MDCVKLNSWAVVLVLRRGPEQPSAGPPSMRPYPHTSILEPGAWWAAVLLAGRGVAGPGLLAADGWF